MKSVAVPVVLLAVLSVLEGRLWLRSARGADRHDGGTALLITIANIGGAIMALALRETAPCHSGWLTFGGSGLALAGAALRLWSVQTLGSAFTLTLQTQRRQALVVRGPYRVLRHPSYLGGQLALCGVGLTFGSAASVAVLVLPAIAAHLLRIRAEEQMMAKAFGQQWHAYASRTWQLVPWLW